MVGFPLSVDSISSVVPQSSRLEKLQNLAQKKQCLLNLWKAVSLKTHCFLSNANSFKKEHTETTPATPTPPPASPLAATWMRWRGGTWTPPPGGIPTAERTDALESPLAAERASSCWQPNECAGDGGCIDTRRAGTLFSGRAGTRIACTSSSEIIARGCAWTPLLPQRRPL